MYSYRRRYITHFISFVGKGEVAEVQEGKTVWNGAECIDLDDWPSPPPDGNIETEIGWRGERIQVWRPDWTNKKKCVFHIMTLFGMGSNIILFVGTRFLCC